MEITLNPIFTTANSTHPYLFRWNDEIKSLQRRLSAAGIGSTEKPCSEGGRCIPMTWTDVHVLQVRSPASGARVSKSMIGFPHCGWSSIRTLLSENAPPEPVEWLVQRLIIAAAHRTPITRSRKQDRET